MAAKVTHAFDYGTTFKNLTFKLIVFMAKDL